MARCYGQGYQVDAAAGQILDALADVGQEEDTLVIWLADHGDAVASHGGMWDKGSTFSEEVARIPMAIRWPVGIDAGRRVSRPVNNMDAAATILAAAGIAPPPHMHSRDLLGVCRGEEAGEEFTFCQHHGHGFPMIQRIIVSERYKYVACLFDGDELYDLAQDPYELHNLVDSTDHADLRAELRTRVLEQIDRIGDWQGRALSVAMKAGF